MVLAEVVEEVNVNLSGEPFYYINIADVSPIKSVAAAAAPGTAGERGSCRSLSKSRYVAGHDLSPTPKPTN